ncbi:MAG: flavodoxin [Tannerella sp.]|jgi:flavodoxin|nr:flavodoxin [Tannerella sp.]
MKSRKFIVSGLLLLAIAVLGGSILFISLYGEKEPEKKMLIVFYSHTGNARFVSELIQTHTGAGVFELIPADPYPEDVNATIERVSKEREDGFIPPLTGSIEKFADYDVIFLGSPNWFGSLSLPAQSFLRSYDLSGKTIVPFITFGRGGLQNTVDDIKKLAPNAIVLPEFGVSRDDVKESRSDIMQWLEQIEIRLSE